MQNYKKTPMPVCRSLLFSAELAVFSKLFTIFTEKYENEQDNVQDIPFESRLVVLASHGRYRFPAFGFLLVPSHGPHDSDGRGNGVRN